MEIKLCLNARISRVIDDAFWAALKKKYVKCVEMSLGLMRHIERTDAQLIAHIEKPFAAFVEHLCELKVDTTIHN
jgi:hypothetical protein